MGMKIKTILGLASVLSLFALCACATDADGDDGFDAGTVCPADGTNGYGMPNRGTFVDERDGQEYKYTTIGNQVWMAQNLNYKTYYSMLHEKEYKDCAECGRWYNLEINLPNRDVMDSVCPAGWRIPSTEDWSALLMTVGSASLALKVLLSESYNEHFQGTNACGFNGVETGFILMKEGYLRNDWNSIWWWTRTMVSAYDIMLINFWADESTNGVEITTRYYYSPNTYARSPYFYYPLRCIMDL